MPLRTPLRTRTVLVGHFGPLTLERHEVTLDTTDYEAFTLNLPDCVNVIAVTDQHQIVMVRQYRHGVDSTTLEAAGGVVDPGEAPEAAARRELYEETGYTADALESLGWVHSNPAIQSNRCHFYLAHGARQNAQPKEDLFESTEVVVMQPEEAVRALREGRITHALGVIALQKALAVLGVAMHGDDLGRVLHLLESMERVQREKVIDLARRLIPHLTAEDIRNPHDFPNLSDPDWHFEDGQLAGIQAVMFAVRALARDGFQDEQASQR